MSIRRTALVTAAPLALAAAGLVHPHRLSRTTAADWAQLHIVLLPIFPLLPLGLLLALWRWPRYGLERLATITAWAATFTYATFYTGLDTVAGIAAGTTVEHAPRTANLPALEQPLFERGDALGHTGAYALIVAVAATAITLAPRHGIRILPGTAVLLISGWSFIDSHIFWPRGVYTMLGFVVGFALLTWATTTSTANTPLGEA